MSQPDDTTLLRTKLHRPPAADDVVPRPHLLERLEQGRRRPLTLVSTPAGYGKSTLLSGWLAAAPCRTAWLSLDEDDGEPRVFLTYVVAALEGPFAGAFSRTRALLGAPDLPPTRVLAATLVNELDALDGELVLVLDDYHLVRSSAIHDIVSTLLAQRPRSLHLAIAARRDPPLPLAALRAAGQLTEVRLEDLRLSREETADFLTRTVPAGVDAASAEALREATEGWPAGLRLASLSLRKGADVSRLVDGLHATGRHVMDYLAAEVVAGVPPKIHDRLLATAILDRFCAPLCETLIGSDRAREGPDAGEAFVAWLEDANLFVIPLDTQHRWLLYHHLFRELRQHLLSVERSSQEIAHLHLDAAGWLAPNDLPDEAIRHALAAGNPDFAACVVEAHRHALMNCEEWSRLERWLRLFPAAFAEADPQLLLVRAWLALEKRYELGDLERVIAQAEAFDAELGLRQGRRFEALQWARRYDPRPLQALPRFFVPQLTWLRVLLAEDTAESQSRAGAFLAEWQPHVERLHHTRYEIDTLVLRALWARADGQNAVAEEALARAVTLARLGGVTRPFLEAGPQLAELLDRLRLEGDDAVFARDILGASGRTGLARASSAAGPAPPVPPLSDREAEILALLAQRLSNKEIADKLHITAETVKRHTVDIYQKLDVHGRREAVETAASLGLLRSQ